MKDDLPSSTSSHELRTPLNAIIGFTGTLLMRLPGPINADQEDQLQIIQKSAKQLLSLIDGMERDFTLSSNSAEESVSVAASGEKAKRDEQIRRARILVVDDHPASSKLIAYLLKVFNYEPLIAADGEHGLALARQEVPDLILCDVHMPKLDGFAVARKLKSDPDLKHIPLVAMTALSTVDLETGGATKTFDHFLQKPIHPETLELQLSAFLAGSVRAQSGSLSPPTTESASQ